MNGNKMKLLKITINPLSPFRSKIEGDMLFGQICWHLFYKDKTLLENLLVNYEKEPFLIISDAFKSNYLPKPKFPSVFLKETDKTKKKLYRRKNWLLIDDLLEAKFENTKEKNFIKTKYEVKNSINRKTFTTDSENFAPYTTEYFEYEKADIYLLIAKEEKLIIEMLEEIGEVGFGKDASLGKGRFEIEKIEDVTHFFERKSNIYIALSSFCMKDNNCENIFYDVYTKFPKTRGDLKNPFKNPLILAKTGAGIICNKDIKFIGKAITNFLNDSKIVHQGYAITLPIGAKQ
jgi:CRISPR-associated protein Csm4